MKKKTRGFLLLEALMSLSLLAVGAMALFESLWIAHQWMERSRLAHRVAMCLDEQAWLTLSNINLPSTSCSGGIAVQVEAAPFSTSLVRIKWTANVAQGDTLHATSVEGFRSAL